MVQQSLKEAARGNLNFFRSRDGELIIYKWCAGGAHIWFVLEWIFDSGMLRAAVLVSRQGSDIMC